MEGNSTTGGAEEELLENLVPKAPDAEGHKHDKKQEGHDHHRLAEAMEVEQEGLVEHQPMLQEDLNFERWKPKPRPERSLGQIVDGLTKYLWNPETREFMGRSGKSWSLIILFYSALYTFLAAMFAACMCCLMWSISIYKPTYNDRVLPPGMMMFPHWDGFDIAFNASDRHSWIRYQRELDQHLKPYDDKRQEERNIQCDQDQYFMQDDKKEEEERKACQFKRSMLEECSGLTDRHYGYSQGKPCILLHMNRILGYLPGKGVPISVSCELRKGDAGVLGDVEFFPKNIFSLKYYPYYGKQRHVNYTSPIVAVRFPSLQLDAHLHVQCKLHGDGIINDSPTDRFLGSVSFSLEVGA
ncbi:protein ATP1B4 [Engraulis encrasicolus]|uniref:protein ATP1B4 n=1 Tax=Engraulis encrasicolus TaxID=184585 RepID=UPI002FD093B6